MTFCVSCFSIAFSAKEFLCQGGVFWGGIFYHTSFFKFIHSLRKKKCFEGQEDCRNPKNHILISWDLENTISFLYSVSRALWRLSLWFTGLHLSQSLAKGNGMTVANHDSSTGSGEPQAPLWPMSSCRRMGTIWFLLDKGRANDCWIGKLWCLPKLLFAS